MLLFLLFSFLGKADQALLVWREAPMLSATVPIFAKDILEFKNISIQAEKTIANIQIAESLPEYQKLNQQQIIKILGSSLREAEQECSCRILFQGHHEAAKTASSQPFSLEAVLVQIQNSLKGHCELCQYDVSTLQQLRGQIPTQYKTWQVRLVAEELRGPSMIRVYFDENFFNPLVLQTLVRIQKPVVTLKQSLSVGHVLQAAHFEVKLQDVTYENRKLLRDEEVIGKEARRSLAKGHTLSIDDLVEHNIVRFGQQVSIEMQKGNFSLEMSGVAQRHGKIGDKIPIKISKTQKQIFAEVIGDSKVRF